MIESMGDIELTDEYWDCECEKNFIHLRSQKICLVCKAEQEDQPDSRVAEVLGYGFVIVGKESKAIAAKKLALGWMKNNLNIINWFENERASLGNEFDLKIYIDGHGNKRATVFSVVKGKTRLENPIEVL